MAGIADWHIGASTILNVRTDPLFFFANLAFGHGTDLPSPGSNEARGHIYSFNGLDLGPPVTGVGNKIQITRDNSFTRGFSTGSIRIGFRKMDIEPPFDSTEAALKGAVGSLFCYAQEVNNQSVTEPAPDPANLEADKIEGFFALIFDLNYFDDSVGFQLRAVGRQPTLGGGKLLGNVSVPLTRSPGDFTGIEFQWTSTTDPGEGQFRPKVVLKGYTFDSDDFSDPVLGIAAAHDYKVVPPAEQTDYRKQQQFLWNIDGFPGPTFAALQNPLCEGLDLHLQNLHGYALEHFEILKP